MKKIYLIAILVFLLLIANVTQACHHDKQEEESKLIYQYLYPKNPVTWEIIENGSWGKLKYRTSGVEFEYIFKGYQLTPKQNYTLIYYPDPWPGNGLICLGSGTVNEEGKLYFSESVDTGSLPSENDENDGAKIWLVLSSDLDCENSKMIAWNPTEYLFEKDLINYSKTPLEKSSKNCEEEIKETEKSDDDNENSFDMKHISVFISSLSNSLDLLMDRFPIIGQIIEKIFFWIFYILGFNIA
jgi:hypothetical protein